MRMGLLLFEFWDLKEIAVVWFLLIRVRGKYAM